MSFKINTKKASTYTLFLEESDGTIIESYDVYLYYMQLEGQEWTDKRTGRNAYIYSNFGWRKFIKETSEWTVLRDPAPALPSELVFRFIF